MPQGPYPLMLKFDQYHQLSWAAVWDPPVECHTLDTCRLRPKVRLNLNRERPPYRRRVGDQVYSWLGHNPSRFDTMPKQLVLNEIHAAPPDLWRGERGFNRQGSGLR